MRRLLAIVLLAATLRLGIVAAMWPDELLLMRQDTIASYLPLVRALMDTGAFTVFPHGPPDTTRTPGYPAFLAVLLSLTGPTLWPTVVIQVVLSLAILVLAARLADEISGEGAGLAAALVMALDPPSTLHSVVLLSETLFTALLAVAMWAAWRCSSRPSFAAAAAAGLALGLDAVVRPIALPLVPLLLLWLALAARASLGRRLAIACLAGALALAPPLAWMARNRAIGAGFMLSTIEGLNALYYRAAPALARARGISWDAANAELERELAKRTPPGTDAATGMNLARSLAFEVLRQHPLDAVAIGVEGAARMWVGPGAGDLLLLLGVARLGTQAHWPQYGPAPIRALASALTVLAWIVHLGILALTFAGLIAWGRERRWRELAFALTLLGAFTVLSAGPGAYARFRVPLMPLVAVIAGSRLRAAAVRPRSLGSAASG